MLLINGYRIDAAISEDHAFDSEVTSHPVEEGADISDHVRAQPVTVTVEGVVSDTPIGLVAAERGADALPSEDAFARMIAIRDAREPVTIATSLRTFENMVLQAFSVPRSASTGEALRFRATFVQISVVVNERTIVQVEVPRAAKKVNLGNKPAPVVEPEEVPPKVLESELLRVGRGLGGILRDIRGGR